MDALSRLRFQSENGEEHENSEMGGDRRKTLNRETQRDPKLSVILERRRKNVWSNCTIAERRFKARHKLTVESDVIFRADTIVIIIIMFYHQHGYP